MNAAVMTIARRLAEKTIKEELRARGMKLTRFTRAEIVAAAKAYLQDCPELRDEAIQFIPNSPELTAIVNKLYRKPSRPVS